MPNALTIDSCLIWFCVGLFTGSDWALGTWLIGKVLR